MTDPIDRAPRDGSYVRIARPAGGYVLASWFRDAWRFANGCELNFEPTHYEPNVSLSTTGALIAPNEGGYDVTRSAERANSARSEKGRREPEQHGSPWPASRRRPIFEGGAR